MSRHIGVVTTARSDFGCLTGVCQLLQASTDLRLSIYAGGMHLSDRHGMTIEEIRESGFEGELVEVHADQPNDLATSVGHAMAAGVAGFTRAFTDLRPDLLVILGDRYDALPAAVAAMPWNIPIAHLCGGEITEGQIDEMIRHALTKLSHLHFVTHTKHAQRVAQLGEEPWRIMISGHPSLDGIDNLPTKARCDLFAEFSLDHARPLMLFTQHPETLKPDESGRLAQTVLDAVGELDTQILFTYPNSDSGSDTIINKIETFVTGRPDCSVVPSLGRLRYFNFLRFADCMVGNSSSGIIDAASFELPVLNIGDRQRGRIAPPNVVSVPPSAAAIRAGLQRVRDPEFRKRLAGIRNPYGDGSAARRIVDRLREIPLDRRLIRKQFVDMDCSHRPIA